MMSNQLNKYQININEFIVYMNDMIITRYIVVCVYVDAGWIAWIIVFILVSCLTCNYYLLSFAFICLCVASSYCYCYNLIYCYLLDS